MKIKFNTNLVINVATVLFVVFLLFQWFSISHRHDSIHFASASRDIEYELQDNLKPIDQILYDTIPYRRYIALKDSIKTIRDLKNGNVIAMGGGQIGPIVGTSGALLYTDSNTYKGYWRGLTSKEKNARLYYITLPGWKLGVSENKPDSYDTVQFYAEHNQAYVRKLVTEKVIKNTNGSITYKMRRVDEPVKFRYHTKGRYLMIPVTEKTKNICDAILLVIGIALGVYMLFLIGCFLKFILDLSKGSVFTGQNLVRLKLIAISLLVYPLFIIVFTWLMKPIFHDYFIPEVVINTETWSNWWIIISLGLIFLLLFRAFRQGKILKEEQDLTV